MSCRLIIVSIVTSLVLHGGKFIKKGKVLFVFGGKHKVCFQVLFVFFFFVQELSRFLCLSQTLNSLLVIMESKVKVKSADDSDAPSEIHAE